MPVPRRHGTSCTSSPLPQGHGSLRPILPDDRRRRRGRRDVPVVPDAVACGPAAGCGRSAVLASARCPSAGASPLPSVCASEAAVACTLAGGRARLPVRRQRHVVDLADGVLADVLGQLVHMSNASRLNSTSGSLAAVALQADALSHLFERRQVVHPEPVDRRAGARDAPASASAPRRAPAPSSRTARGHARRPSSMASSSTALLRSTSASKLAGSGRIALSSAMQRVVLPLVRALARRRRRRTRARSPSRTISRMLVLEVRSPRGSGGAACR